MNKLHFEMRYLKLLKKLNNDMDKDIHYELTLALLEEYPEKLESHDEYWSNNNVIIKHKLYNTAYEINYDFWVYNFRRSDQKITIYTFLTKIVEIESEELKLFLERFLFKIL